MNLIVVELSSSTKSNVEGSAKTPSMFTVQAAGIVGTVIDWYDFLVYGSLTAILARVFFPQTDPAVGVIATLGVFGVGFIARPLGGIFFGMLADRIGRKTVFLITIILIGIATAAMGIIPTYQQVGLAASALLVFLRLLQGLALGGEYSGAMTYIGEYCRDDRRGFNSAILNLSGNMGTLLSTVVVLWLSTSLSANDMAAYGWRIAFMFSLVLVAFGLIMRRKLGETPAFKKIKREGTAVKTVAEGLKLDWKTVATMIAGLGVPVGLLAYSASLTAPIMYMTSVMKPPLSLPTASLLTIIFCIMSIPVALLFGYLSDRAKNRKKFVYGSIIACALLIYPGYYLISYGTAIGNFAITALGPIIAGIGYWALLGPMIALWVEMFPTKVRQASFGFAYGLGIGMVGFTPFVVSYITYIAKGNFFAGLAFPVVTTLILSLVGILKVRETHATMAE